MIFETQPDIVYAVYLSFILANLLIDSFWLPAIKGLSNAPSSEKHSHARDPHVFRSRFLCHQ